MADLRPTFDAVIDPDLVSLRLCIKSLQREMLAGVQIPGRFIRSFSIDGKVARSDAIHV